MVGGGFREPVYTLQSAISRTKDPSAQKKLYRHSAFSVDRKVLGSWIVGIVLHVSDK